MINAAIMMLEQIKNIVQGILSGTLLVEVNGLTASVLTLFIFYWVIFAFLYWLRSLMSRR